MINYLGIAGRKVGKELLGRDALISGFSLGTFAASDTFFDIEKLLWLNKEHIRAMDVDALLRETGIPREKRDKVAVLKENVRTLNDVEPMLGIFETADVSEESVEHIGSFVRDVRGALDLLRNALTGNDPEFEDLFARLQERTGFPRRELLMFLRIAMTGRKNGPPLSELYPLIPKGSILTRIECLSQRLSNPTDT
jgi:glutamyl/glutaminyl-tRNA synthetase